MSESLVLGARSLSLRCLLLFGSRFSGRRATSISAFQLGNKNIPLWLVKTRSGGGKMGVFRAVLLVDLLLSLLLIPKNGTRELTLPMVLTKPRMFGVLGD